MNTTVAAFRTAGVGNLHFFTLDGGQHDATAWATTFAAGVTRMFAANFTAPYQMQYTTASAVNVLYPVVDNDCPAIPAEATTAGPDPAGHSGAACDETATPVGLLVVVCLLLILVLFLFALLWRERAICGYPWPCKGGGNPYAANPTVVNASAGNTNFATTA